MMKIDVHTINAFSINNSGGNPAGVVLNADALSLLQKQLIATKAGFAETAFVSHSATADFKLDFFTPTKQIPHCGHATIAVFSYLKQNGMIPNERSSKETIEGDREIVFKNGHAFMQQTAPTYLVPDTENQQMILSSLGLCEADLISDQLPTIVNTGNSFLIIPLENTNALQQLKVDHDIITDISQKFGLIGYYPFALLQNGSHAVATTRMFAPYYGINEESATGMAAGPLACYLYDKALVRSNYITIEQGIFMQPASPSLIYVELDILNENINKLYAGGGAHVAGKIEIDI